MEAIKISNAQIVSVMQENVQLKSGDWRVKQSVTFTENSSNGVTLHGCVVWDENIGRLNLKQGEVCTLSCRLVGRQWGGRFSYELVAFNTERQEQQLQEGNDPFNN